MFASDTTDRDTATWSIHVYGHGRDLLHLLHRELQQGAPLTLSPSAWENTMAAFEWMIADLAARRMAYVELLTGDDVDLARRVRELGRIALAGGPRAPELLPLIERLLVKLYGPGWATLPEWPAILASERRRARAPAATPLLEPPPAIGSGMWMAEAYSFGAACLPILFRELEGDAAHLPIDPVAWDNTMAALVWTAQEISAGRAQIARPVEVEDVERLRRLRVLGAEALAGGARAPELRPLVERCLVALYGPAWRTDVPDPGQGFPPS